MATMRLVDSHCHLQVDRFADDLGAVLEAARASGVERILVPGMNVETSVSAIGLARRVPWLHVSAGVHPHDAANVDEAGWREIVRLAEDPAVVAIGETGLDFDRLFSPVDIQLSNLRRNLLLSRRLGKPVILHCRSRPGESDAQDALLRELDLAGVRGGDRPPAVLHSYSGPVAFGAAALERGLAISFSGLVFRRGEEASAEVARLVPVERLLVETDSPYLSPPGAPRRRNAPEWVRMTGAWLAEHRGTTPETLGDGLVAAYDRIFAIA
jgi:TatD DNase family protein